MGDRRNCRIQLRVLGSLAVACALLQNAACRDVSSNDRVERVASPATLGLVIPNPEPDSGDLFGSSFAAVGNDKVLVGAFFDDPAGVPEAGSAYLMSATSGAPILALPNPAPETNDRFGHAVAALERDLVVGAWLDDPGGIQDSGSVYVFDGVTGALRHTIPNPAPQAGDFFGSTLATLGDRILIGAASDNPGGLLSAGSMYVVSATSGAVVLTIPNPEPGIGDLFGGVMTPVGPNILVAAPGDLGGIGSAYVLDGTTGAVILRVDNPDQEANDGFATSIASRGTDLIVGAKFDSPGGVVSAGSVHVFDGSNGALLLTIRNPEPDENDFFGTSVAGIGDDILVGAYADDAGGVVNAGSAYLFDGDTGELLVQFSIPDSKPADLFGGHVDAIGSDILVGAMADDAPVASETGSVFLFRVGNPPVAHDSFQTTAEDTPLSIVLSGNDPEGGPFSFSLVSLPSNGTLSGSPPAVEYTPDPDFSGLDTFTFKVTNGPVSSPTGRVLVDVLPVQDPPIANADGDLTAEDVPITIDVRVNDTDADGDALSISGLTQPANGTATVNLDQTVTYTPAADFHGVDGFEYTLSDGSAVSVGEVSLLVLSVDDGPPSAPVVISPLDGSEVADAAPVLVVTAAVDPDGDSLEYRFEVDDSPGFSGPALQSVLVSGTGQSVSWTPTPLSEDRTHFWRVRASDNHAAGDWVLASFFLSTTNHAAEAPVAVWPRKGELTSRTPTLLAENTLDPEGSTLTYEFEVRAETPEGEIVITSPLIAGGAGEHTEWSVPEKLDAGATFYWAVRASDGLAYSDWSVPASFETKKAAEKESGFACSVGESNSRGRAGIQTLVLGAFLVWRSRRAGATRLRSTAV